MTKVKCIRKLCREVGVEWRKTKEVTVESKEKNRSAVDLLEEIKSKNKNLVKRHMRADEVRKAAETLSISLTKTIQTNVTPTWVGKPKGMFDIAYERGLLDLTKFCVEDFTEKGLPDHEEETSLVILLSKCSDFMNKETLLTKMVKKMGATLERSQKYHYKLAGEGKLIVHYFLSKIDKSVNSNINKLIVHFFLYKINQGIEYSWGNAKMCYRRTPYSMRSKTDQFMKVLKNKCLSRDFLTIDRVRTNSKRARDYMAAYFVSMHNDSSDEGTREKNTHQLSEMKACAIPANRIERMRRSFKTHRSAFDFDTSFCNITFYQQNDEVKKRR